jgi:predicted MPP superfamily phosphohydrolase
LSDVLRFLVFLVPMVLLSAAINLHVYRWIARSFTLSRGARRAVLLATLGTLAFMVLGRFVEFWLQLGISPVVLAASVVQLIVLLTAVLLLPLDVARLARYVRKRFFARPPTEVGGASAGNEGALPDGSRGRSLDVVPRRAFLEQAGVTGSILIASSTSLYGALKERHDYRIEDVPIRIPGLKSTLDGFTIVQLSDVHIGPHVGKSELAAAWDLVRSAKPDLIVLTGDLLDSDPRLAAELGRFARRLGELAPKGVVAISGNHDFYAGIDPTCRALTAGGATVLRNQGIILGDSGGAFALLGVDDVMAPRFTDGIGADLPLAMKSLPQSQDLPRVLLCHNPEYFEHAAGHVDLQLSGHTHGGQINPGISPADLVLPHDWIRGKYEHRGSTIYVNRGFGTVGPPVRIGSPPEITRIVLHS